MRLSPLMVADFTIVLINSMIADSVRYKRTKHAVILQLRMLIFDCTCFVLFEIKLGGKC